MPTYLIEIPHSGNLTECNNVIRLFVESGSHLLSNASWGCKDGVHKAWFINDFDNKEDVMKIIPPFLRENAVVVELCKFSKDDMAGFAHG